MFLFKFKKNNKKDKKGFVVLLAVLVSTLLISIGAFVANLILKEFNLTSSSVKSQIAFYAADSAMECALIQDFKIQEFQRPGFSGPGTITCDGEVGVSVNKRPSSSTRSVSYFEVHFKDEDGNKTDSSPFAIVEIIKTSNNATQVYASGYNVKNEDFPDRYERAIRVAY